MKFTEWYEKNKEALSTCTDYEAMRRAWAAAYVVASEEMYKLVLDGLRGPFVKRDTERRDTVPMGKVIICKTCGFTGPLNKYLPCLGYSDIQCPECFSTRNEHNSELKKKIFKPDKGR